MIEYYEKNIDSTLSLIKASLLIKTFEEKNLDEAILKFKQQVENENCEKTISSTPPQFIPNEIKTQNLISISYLGAFSAILPIVILNNDYTNSLTNLQILSSLYLGIVPTGIGFFLWNKGAKLVPSSILAIMNNLKIPFGVLFSILIFNEKINLINFSIGSLIIILAIFIMNRCIKADL